MGGGGTDHLRLPVAALQRLRRKLCEHRRCDRSLPTSSPATTWASTLRVVVTASNGAGEASATSSASDVVAARTRLANVSVPEIGGSTRAGATLSADPGNGEDRRRSPTPTSGSAATAPAENARTSKAQRPRYTRSVKGTSRTRCGSKVTATNGEGSASATSPASSLIVAGSGSGIRYLYDEAGRLSTSWMIPTQGAAVYHWDADGNLLSIQRYSASTLAVLAVTPDARAARDQGRYHRHRLQHRSIQRRSQASTGRAQQ